MVDRRLGMHSMRKERNSATCITDKPYRYSYCATPARRYRFFADGLGLAKESSEDVQKRCVVRELPPMGESRIGFRASWAKKDRCELYRKRNGASTTFAWKSRDLAGMLLRTGIVLLDQSHAELTARVAFHHRIHQRRPDRTCKVHQRLGTTYHVMRGRLNETQRRKDFVYALARGAGSQVAFWGDEIHEM